MSSGLTYQVFTVGDMENLRNLKKLNGTTLLEQNDANKLV